MSSVMEPNNFQIFAFLFRPTDSERLLGTRQAIDLASFIHSFIHSFLFPLCLGQLIQIRCWEVDKHLFLPAVWDSHPRPLTDPVSSGQAQDLFLHPSVFHLGRATQPPQTMGKLRVICTGW